MPSLRVFLKAKELIANFISAPKISKILLGLIIFFSATQLGYHFWPESALVYGIRVDYLAPTLYFLDLLIILYLLVVAKFENWRIYDLRFVFPLLLTNLLFSANPLTTISWSLHFLLYLMFVSTIKFENLKIYDLRFILTFTLLFQVALALAQVTLGHSLQGPLYYLGERMVAVGQPSVATASFMGATALRAYGTFSHPNVLAGWLVISFLIQLRSHKLENWRIFDLRFTIPLVSLGLLLTQSRAATLAFFGLVIPFSLLHSLRSRLIYFVILLFTSCYLLFTNSFSRPFDLSISQRFSLQQISLQTISRYPLFGTGANASISTYPSLPPTKPLGAVGRLLQPDHNSFTLITSWFGLFGTLALLAIFRSQFEHWRIYDLRFVLPLTPLLLLDHYLLTSPQGLFILLLFISVVHSYHAPQTH